MFSSLRFPDPGTLVIPALLSLILLSLEPLLLSLRLFILIPARHGIRFPELRNLYFKAQFLSHFSASAVGDLYRFRALGRFDRGERIGIPDRLQFLAIERLSESVALPLVGILFTDLATVRKMIPIPSPWIFLGILGVAAGILLFRKNKREKNEGFARPDPKRVAMVLLLSSTGWVIDLLALSLLTRQEGIPLSELMVALIGVSVASIPPLPWGRWGLFEGILGAALHQSGVPLERALALAGVFHVVMVLPFAALTLYSWLKDRGGRPPEDLSR